MPSKSRAQSTTTGRSLIYTGFGILLAVIGIVVFNRGGSNEVPGSDTTPTNQFSKEGLGNSPSQNSASDEGPSSPLKTRSTNRKTGESEDLAPGQFPLVERIISDTTQTDIVAAESLAEIARRTDVSVEERFEALAHGLNLDFKSFANFASDPNLPLELVQRYLDELLNQNRNPTLQIVGCLALLNHSDKGIQTQAADQLAFLVEKESLVEFHDQLREAALERLEFLKKNPPIKSSPDSSTDDLEASPE